MTRRFAHGAGFGYFMGGILLLVFPGAPAESLIISGIVVFLLAFFVEKDCK